MPVTFILRRRVEDTGIKCYNSGMNSEQVEKTVNYWLTSSEYDLDVAKSLFEKEKYHYALFFGHLTLGDGRMVEGDITDVIKRFVVELKKEGIDVIKVFLYGSYAKGKNREDSDIDVAVVCEDFGTDPIDQNMKMWRIAVRVDTRLAPLSFSLSDFKKEYIPIVTEIKNGLDMTEIAAWFPAAS